MKRIIIYGIAFCFCLALCILPADSSAKLPPEQKDAYQQMSLYIQEGFRTYHIDDTYQAYFASIEDSEKGTCDILLEGENEWWEERIAYSYDAENGWYTFEGVFEPIFTQDRSFYKFRGYEIDQDADFVANMRKTYVYSAEISKKTDMTLPIRYDSENGPIECDLWKMTPDSERTESYIKPYLYTYYDDRMDIYITIEYPQVSLEDNELEEQINAELKQAFFYSYGYEEKNEWNPTDEAYGEITRNYVITREDEECLSIRIYEYNDFRGANHPNEWEQVLTINMKTGEPL